MPHSLIPATLLALTLSTAAHAADHYLIVRCGTLMTSADQPPKSKQTLIIKNGLIDEIRDGLTGPDPATLKAANGGGNTVEEFNLSDRYVLPGLIDCHVHLTTEYDATIRARLTVETDSFITLRAAAYAKKTLDAGFTTVRDLGSYRPEPIFALRDGINQGLIVGPRIISAGHPIAMTGGHGDFTLGFRPDIWGPQTPNDGIADGPDECMKAVRTQIKNGADVIKVTATGGVLSASKAGLAQHYFDNELESIVKTAHSLGRKVAAHAHGVDGINAALRAGVDSIEHGTYLDDDSIKLFKEHNAYHVPTLLAAATVAANAEKPGFYLPMVAAKARIVGPKAIEMFKKSHEAGVKIAFGTDTGVSPHGENAREFSLMVSAGMTPIETIKAATITASELLGLEKEIGTLEPGKAADLIAVHGDPTKDVKEFEHVLDVVRAGVPVLRELGR